MAKYTQAGRALSVTTPLGADALLLEKVSGGEGISELFRFQLDMLAEAPVAFDRVLAKPATLSINLPNRSGRRIHGIIKALSKGKRVRGPGGAGTLLRYRAELVPAAWLLTRRIQSRIFQHDTVPDILTKILHDEWQLSIVNRLTGTYPRRNFCVQYRESDWAFVSRLMEDEGIAYYFQHDDKGHHLVLADHPSAFAELSQFGTVAYDEAEGGTRHAPVVCDWEQAQEVGTYLYTVSDYHFEKPDDRLMGHRMAGGTIAAGAVAHPLDLQQTINGVAMLEVYEPRGEFAYHRDGVNKDGGEQPQDLQLLGGDLERHARIRQEEETAAQMRIRGGGDCGHFLPGHRFQLTRHPDCAEQPGDDDRYLLTRVELTASQEGAYTSGSDANVQPVSSNRFECLPLKLPFRPRRVTPKPRIDGSQTATVTAPSGQPLFLDRFGRVKVRFHWDRNGPTDAGSSCWVRVGQTWAGNRWGAFFWPRVGHEVIVNFEDGDPDRPIIVGSVYNAQNMPPFELPAHPLVSGIKSCSIGPGADPLTHFNGVLFYDQMGEERAELHSQHKQITQGETEHWVRTGQRYVQMVGGFPLIGSGSGGGGAGNHNPAPHAPQGEHNAPHGPGATMAEACHNGWAEHFAFTYGDHANNVLGAAGEYVVGNERSLVINPISWASQFGPADKELFTAGSVVGGVWFNADLAEVKLCVGTGADLHYGTGFEVHQGRHLEGSHKANRIVEFMQMILGGSTIGINVLAASGNAPAGWAVVRELILKAIYVWERWHSWSDVADHDAAHGAAQAHQAQQRTNSLIAIVTRHTEATEYLEGEMEVVHRLLHDSIWEVKSSVDALELAVTQAKKEARQSSSANRTYEGPYTLTATEKVELRCETGTAEIPPKLTFRSAAPSVAAVAGTSSPARKSSEPSFDLSAHNGSITSESLVVKARKTFLVSSRKDVCFLLVNENGVGAKVHGSTSRDSSFFTLKRDGGVFLGCGESPDKGSKLSLNPCEIKVTGQEITLTADDKILLQCGKNSISVTPEGVQIDALTTKLKAELETSIKTPLEKVTADIAARVAKLEKVQTT